PFPRELYDDVNRFSNGKIDPVDLAIEQLRQFIERTIEDSNRLWGDHVVDVAAKYAPDVYQRWQREPGEREAVAKAQPLVWKELTIPSGSEVRMTYGGQHYTGKVRGGQIIDDGDGRPYSPSGWANKTAGGTARNAWRDLWFRVP